MDKFFIKIIIVFFFLLSSASSEILQKIEISGNKRISDQTIIVFSEIKINEEITKSKLDEVIKKLYKTNPDILVVGSREKGLKILRNVKTGKIKNYSKNNGNISNIQVISRDLDFYKFNIDLEVRNLSHLNQIIAAVRLSHFVESVQRGKE